MSSLLPRRALVLAALVSLPLASCVDSALAAGKNKSKADKKAAEAPPSEAAPAPVELPAYAKAMLSARDTSVSPCDDFYQYACGGWIKETPLPADKPSWTRSFSVINDQNLASMRTLLDGAVASPGTDPDRQRLAAYYGSCTDQAAADKAGLTPLQPLFAEIDGVKDFKGFMALSGKLSTMGVSSVLGSDVDSDFADPSTVDLFLYQGGLSLPDRDYYLKDDDASKALVAALQAHIAATLARTGVPQAQADAQAAAIVKLEHALASASLPRTELRSPEKIFNKVDRAGLKKMAPKLMVDVWLQGAGAPPSDALVATAPETFKKFGDILTKTDVGTLRAYLRWQTVHGLASALDDTTYQAEFALFGTKVLGQQKPEDRWKRCVRSTNGALGELLGKEWVKDNFPGDSKAQALGMLDAINTAFASGLPALSWMDDPTREKAREKASSLIKKIGYPDSWRDYSAVTFTTSYVDNVRAARAFESKRVMGKVGKPVDKSEWYMSPPTVNAYYNPTWNEMVFPAGILQPPFFDHTYPTAMNYGGIGMVMGHELSHGFDDEGRKFASTGQLMEWWPAEVAGRFEERAACVEKQYDGFQVGEGLNVNGKLTLGENIADLGGTRVAYRAYKAQAANGKPANIPGLTDDQVYFLAMAQGWCSVSSPEWEKMLVLSNPHSPAKFRVNGPLANLPEFAEAFSCAEGTPMHPKDACEVW